MPSIFDSFPGFLELGAWTTRHIRPLFDLFRDEDVAPALALIIFGSALALCFLFIIDSSFIRIQVRRRIRAVRSIKGKVEFAEAMPAIERLMLRTRYLRHSWQKFRETLIEPSGDEDRGPKVVLNTARPQNYFNTAEDHGHVKANVRVAENLYRKATGDGREAVIAAIFGSGPVCFATF